MLICTQLAYNWLHYTPVYYANAANRPLVGLNESAYGTARSLQIIQANFRRFMVVGDRPACNLIVFGLGGFANLLRDGN